MFRFCVVGLASMAFASAEPWPRHTIDDSSKGADGVRLADVNGDGLLDIATGWEEGGIVRAYLHPGHELAREKWPAVTVGEVKSPEDAFFADLDGDGRSEVVSCSEGNTRTVHIHWSSARGEFLDPAGWKTEAVPATVATEAWMQGYPMQVDGLHGPDLIVGSKGKGSVSWLQAPADARDLEGWELHRLHEAGWIMSLIPADMDGDGDADLLVSDRKGPKRGVCWLEYPGEKQAAAGDEWKRHDLGATEWEILFISRGDLDQDGKTDVIGIAPRSIVWLRNTGQGWEEIPIPLPEGVGTGKSAAVADIDGDSRNDLVFSCEHAGAPLSGMRWLSHDGSPRDGRWTSHEIAGPEGLKYDRIEISDVDGDGDPDILCCEERDGLGVFWHENR